MTIDDIIARDKNDSLIKHEKAFIWYKVTPENKSYSLIYVNYPVQLLIPFENYSELYKK